MTARPFLKWAGGKTQLLPELLKRVPASYGTYHEPFLGGGALFFALAPKRAVLSDANRELIDAYVVVRDHVEELIATLRDLEKLYIGAYDRSTTFYAVREELFETLRPIEAAARTIFLNKTCFNGIYRVNRTGGFNVPHGKYKNPAICDADNLRACSTVLQGVDIRCRDFCWYTMQPGDFVYYDPPYVPMSKTADFTAYTADGFGPMDHEDLARQAALLRDCGVHVLLSNAGLPAVASLYRSYGFVVEAVAARRSVNSKAGARGAVKEYIVSAAAEAKERACR